MKYKTNKLKHLKDAGIAVEVTKLYRWNVTYKPIGDISWIVSSVYNPCLLFPCAFPCQQLLLFSCIMFVDTQAPNYLCM